MSRPGTRSVTLQPSPSAARSSGSATTSDSVPSVATTYSTPGLTATAVLETRVHGVVVHTSSDAVPACGPDVSGSRTYTDGSATVS
jgi:hypothetical protein